jgi:hypothetical protein
MFKLYSLSFMVITLTLLLRVGSVNGVPVTNEPTRLYSSALPTEGSYDERMKMIWKEQYKLVKRLLLAKAQEFDELFKELNISLVFTLAYSLECFSLAGGFL